MQRDGKGNRRERGVFRRVRVRTGRRNGQVQRVQIQVHHQRGLRVSQPQDRQMERYDRRATVHGELYYIVYTFAQCIYVVFVYIVNAVL